MIITGSCRIERLPGRPTTPRQQYHNAKIPVHIATQAAALAFPGVLPPMQLTIIHILQSLLKTEIVQYTRTRSSDELYAVVQSTQQEEEARWRV